MVPGDEYDAMEDPNLTPAVEELVARMRQLRRQMFWCDVRSALYLIAAYAALCYLAWSYANGPR